MKITKVKCTRIVENSKILATFSAEFDDVLIIRDIKLIDGSKGKFISWPNRAYKDEDEVKYYDQAFITDKELKSQLEDKIKKAYKKAKEEDDE